MKLIKIKKLKKVVKTFFVFVLVTSLLALWPAVVYAAQFERPDSDVTLDAWGDPTTNCASNSNTANVWDEMDEVTADDATTCAQSGNNPTSPTQDFEVSLSNITDPQSSTGHIIRFRARKVGTTKTMTLVGALYQGTTRIAATAALTLTQTWTTQTYTLSAAEADSITDYNDLRIRFEPATSGGGAANQQLITWAEFETPDAPLSYTQNDFEWFEDEATLTLTLPWGNPDLAENQDILALPVGNNPPAVGNKIRLQINITPSANITAGTQAFKIQFKTGTDQDCTTGVSWTDVGAIGTTTVAWRFFDNASLTDGATQVNQISTSAAGQEGRYLESHNSVWTNPLAVTGGNSMEWDFAIESVSGQVVEATSYAFRVVKFDGTVISYITGDCPTLETRPVIANLMRHGNFFVSGVEKGFFWAD